MKGGAPIRFRLALVLASGLVVVGSGCGRQADAVAPSVVAPAGQNGQGATRRPAAADKSTRADRAGKLIADALRPSDKVGSLPWEKSGGSRRRRNPRPVDRPEVPLPVVAPELPRVAVVNAATPVRPPPLPDEPPLTEISPRPVSPQRPRLPKGPLVRVPGPDLGQPVPLPILGHAQLDRGPLTDPSAEASLAAALAQSIPLRTTPAPFVRLNLPDPFEHRHAVRLASPPDEDPNPPAAIVRTPKK